MRDVCRLELMPCVDDLWVDEAGNLVGLIRGGDGQPTRVMAHMDELSMLVKRIEANGTHHYLAYCSELLSLTAKTAALCAEHSTDAVVLETIATIETLTTELSNKIWQKISLLSRA